MDSVSIEDYVFSFPAVSGLKKLPESLPVGSWISYQLSLEVFEAVTLQIGRLGSFTFRPGDYLYSGSARRGLKNRIDRHLRRKKKLRWHIDYLLHSPAVEIYRVLISTRPECELVQKGGGVVVVPGFGASDCRSGCGSHLRMVTVPDCKRKLQRTLASSVIVD
ncbi:MAG: GIY-YIG nuclease family protein [Deltaproteobacteria bacterium]|nr:GIY-YIG nuclease family protein [Deltaproteobacteria bacterium]